MKTEEISGVKGIEREGDGMRKREEQCNESDLIFLHTYVNIP